MIWRIPEKFHAVDAHTHLNMMPGKDYSALRTEAALAMLADGDRLGIEKFCISLPYITPRVTPEEFRRGNDIIFDAVMESLTSKKRPKEDAPILHCGVNSISGGTMSAVAEFANSNLTSELHFIFEVDPDPAYQNTRLRLYMYYESDIDNANIGDSILVYKQIISRGSDGVWFADGTYIGSATVGDYFGGGSAGKDVTTISPYTWVSNAKTTEE